MNRRVRAATGLTLFLLACSRDERPSPAALVSSPCRVEQSGRRLPPAVRETSGLALGRRSPGVLWTHNDSGNEPVLFAFDSAGTLLGQVRVTGAGLVDWEDLAAGPCEAGTCLFIADIGDNGGRRDSVSIYMVPEPEPAASETAPAAVLHARYPDGPRDAEAMFVLPSGDIHIVSKGRRDSIALYRLSKSNQRPGGTVVLERVRALWPRPASSLDHVTGAGASPDGRWVTIRTYRTLYIYASGDLTGPGSPPLATFDLRPLGERQGEAVALNDSGGVWLSSEARAQHGPRWAHVACTLQDSRNTGRP